MALRKQNGPGQSQRTGITILELVKMFPDDTAARGWFEAVRWPNGRHCPKCGCSKTGTVKSEKPMPYWCGMCRSYFSVKTGTAMQSSNLGYQKMGIRDVSHETRV